MRPSPRIAIAALWACGTSAALDADLNPTVIAQPVSTASVLYDWQHEHCETWDTPDAPLRAFRNANNQVVVFVSDSNSRMFTGPNLMSVKHSCHSAFTSIKDPDPADFNDLRYITATWTDDGIHVIALTHTEYHAEQFPGMCTQSVSMACWYNVVLGLKSSDGGNAFVATTPLSLIAAPNFKQEFEQGRHRGFFNPSNIVASGGYWYALINTTGGGAQKQGTCLFRTATINDLNSWRAYDGQEYSSRAVSPYVSGDQPAIPCQPVPLHGVATSVSYYPAVNQFLAVIGTGPEKNFPNGRIAYQWSPDLIRWSEARTLIEVPTMAGGPDCNTPYRYGYPSVADPNSPSRNFDVITSSPMLFMTRFHTDKCTLRPERDLVAVHLKIA
jgi:hypothetical protein